GFIRISRNDDLFMEFDNKKPFYAIGLNLCWSTGNVLKDYERWLSELKENGGNFIRLWMANWFVGIEWIETGIGNYEQRQKQAFLLDKILEMCKEKGIYVMLCLIPHGEFSTKTNSNWDNNPYNLKNDGLLREPSEFFTDMVARQAFKNRLRYIIARWGYSPNIFSWEIFNENEWIDNYNTDNAIQWYKDIISYIKQLDVNKHLISTSYANPGMDAYIWNLKDINFTQTHFYGVKDGLELYELSKEKLHKYSKPHIIGEFGMEGGEDFIRNNLDPNGISLINSIWTGAFTLSFGSPMPWNWDNYIDKNNLFRIFKPLSEFIKDARFQDEDLIELIDKKIYFKNIDDKSAGNVIFYAKSVWERPKKDRFIINVDGEMVDSFMFNGFIFGDKHSDMKKPPVFIFKNIRPSKFIVKINKISSDNLLVINLNGIDILKKELKAENYPNRKFFPEWNIFQSEVSEEFSIDLPIGDNEVKIDNYQGDWFNIEYIKITDFLDPHIAPAFVSGMQGPNTAYIFIKHKDYSFKNVSPPEIKDAYINIENLNEGRYLYNIINPESGDKILEGEKLTIKGALKLDLPAFNKSIAVKIKNLSVKNKKNEKSNNRDFKR
ncbi:MAG: glycoside hydrolase family 5 protein, partial [Candidatus Goldbacteria bacterium]|nr:glycoside hydrolase family 5 protein [Candidatus Goldiibacteriota bacterium]